jgi:hypothetical protein
LRRALHNGGDGVRYVVERIEQLARQVERARGQRSFAERLGGIALAPHARDALLVHHDRGKTHRACRGAATDGRAIVSEPLEQIEHDAKPHAERQLR